MSNSKYQFHTTPWDHQKTAMRLAWGKPAFAFLMEMGSGKTKVAIDECCALFERMHIDAMVVMAPKGVYKNWVRHDPENPGEFQTHMPPRLLKKAVIATWEPNGGNRENLENLKKALTKGDGLRIFVINTESVQTAGKARLYLEKFLKTHSVYWALDESTFIKNQDASRTKYIVKVGKLAKFRRIMTGTPDPRSPMDFYSQFDFLDEGLLGFKSFYSFRSRYAVTQKKNFTPKALTDQGKRGRDVTVVVGYRNLDELKRKIGQYSFRITKDECMDLPPKIYTRRDVELTLEQVRIYDEIKNDFFSTLGDESFISMQNVITQMIRLQQVLSGFTVDNDGIEHAIPSNRPKALLEEIEGINGKVIIWSRFKRDIENITTSLASEYGEKSIAQFHGGNVKTREHDADRFINDKECRFMVSNQQAGGRGNTWIVAHDVIYYSNDFDLEKRMQSEDRCHRGGQKHSVRYVDLISPGTIDEKIVFALKRKMDLASIVKGDQLKQWLV